MRWQFEVSDVPDDARHPIKAFQIMDNGVKRGPFYLAIDDFIAALQQEPENIYDADGEMKAEESTPTLPFGTIRYSTNQNKTRHRITMLMNKKMWDIRYFDIDELLYIGFPRMIIQYLVVPNNGNKKYHIAEMRIFAVEDNKPITDNTPLYYFPYPNVSKENGIVCWGQNERLEINSLVELERAFLWFVSSPFNEDHGVRTTFGINRFKNLIEKIKDKPFDDDWLIPINKNFGDLYTK